MHVCDFYFRIFPKYFFAYFNTGQFDTFSLLAKKIIQDEMVGISNGLRAPHRNNRWSWLAGLGANSSRRPNPASAARWRLRSPLLNNQSRPPGAASGPELESDTRSIAKYGVKRAAVSWSRFIHSKRDKLLTAGGMTLAIGATFMAI
jgi:hypothetical protein